MPCSTRAPTASCSRTSERRLDGAHQEAEAPALPAPGAGMTHPFLALTDSDREEMLGTIGVGTVDELFRDLPEAVRFGRELELEPALSEQEVFAHLSTLAERNADASRELSFLGAGMYDHYVPAVVDAVLQRGELLTGYPPYQPEM